MCGHSESLCWYRGQQRLMGNLVMFDPSASADTIDCMYNTHTHRMNDLVMWWYSAGLSLVV